MIQDVFDGEAKKYLRKLSGGKALRKFRAIDDSGNVTHLVKIRPPFHFYDLIESELLHWFNSPLLTRG